MTARPRSSQDSSERCSNRPLFDEDAKLVERIKSGETECFGDLVAKYQDRVFNTCWRICGHLEDARDTTQETFLRVLDQIDKFRQQSAFYTWLFRIAVNLALTHRRRAKTRHAVSLDQDRNAAGSQAERLAQLVRDESADDPGKTVARAELQARMASALHELDEDHRAAVVLRDIEGLSYHEIGEILQIPPGTVRSRLHRARMALREAVRPAVRRQQEG